MAILTIDQLGPYRFRHWLGPPPPRPRQQSQMLTYPGTNYQAVRLLGLRTLPFRRDSIVDVPNIAYGRLLFAEYLSLIVIGQSRLIWANYDFDIENIRATVLDCELVSLHRNIAICNPLTTGNLVDLRVRWTMTLTPVPS